MIERYEVNPTIVYPKIRHGGWRGRQARGSEKLRKQSSYVRLDRPTKSTNFQRNNSRPRKPTRYPVHFQKIIASRRRARRRGGSYTFSSEHSESPNNVQLTDQRKVQPNKFIVAYCTETQAPGGGGIHNSATILGRKNQNEVLDLDSKHAAGSASVCTYISSPLPH